jgi:hypothetical protein
MDERTKALLQKLAGLDEQPEEKKAPTYEEVLQKLASVQESVTLTKEEVDLILSRLAKTAGEGEVPANQVANPENVGTATPEGPAKPENAPGEEIRLVDADGDGTPDTIVGDPEVLVQALNELYQAGVIGDQQYQMAMALIQAHLAQEEVMEKQASAELSPAARKLAEILGVKA